MRRDELVVLLGEFVARIRQSGDHSQALAPSVVAVAADLAKSRRGTPDVEAGYVLGWLHWLQAQVLLGADREAALHAALDLLSPAATMIGEIDFPEPLLPALAEAAQAQLTAALQEAARTGDLALLDDVISGYRHSIDATPPDDPALARRLSFFGAAFFTRFQLTGDKADVDRAVAPARRAVELGTKDADFDKYLSNLSGFLTTRYQQTRDPADLDESIAAGRQAIQAAGGRGQVTEQLTNLGGALLTRFELTGAPADLAEAVAVTRRAAASPPGAARDRPSVLNNLARALYQSFGHGGPATDLDEAVSAARLAAREGAGQPQESTFLATFADALRGRFELAGAAADLDEAIAAGRRLVAVRGGGRFRDLTGLTMDLLVRFGRDHTPADLDEAAAAGRRAVEAAPPELRLGALRLLDQLVSARFGVSGAPADEDEVIATRRAIVAATPSGDPGRGADLTGLGFALLNRFRARRDPRDQDEAVDVLRAAVPAAATAVERLTCHSDLCVALFARFQARDARGDLDEAASIARAVSPADGPAGVLLNFAHLLDQRARTAAVLDDLDLAVDLVRHSAAATESARPPVERPHGYLRLRADGVFDDGADRREPTLTEVLRLLGAYLRRRFAWTNLLADVDEAIEVARRLVAMTGDAAEHTRALATLSFTLKSRWLEARREADLDEAVATGRRALAGDPDDPRLIVALSDTLKHRFDHHHADNDLDEAIALGRRAVESGPGGENPDAYANLSTLLRDRFDRHRDPADLDEAIALGRRAVEAGPADDFDRPNRLFTLARALSARIGDRRRPGTQADTGPDADRAEALDLVTTVAGHPAAAPRLRVECAKLGAWLAVEQRSPGDEDLVLGARLLESAVHLLPELAPHRMARPQQQGAIGTAAGLADDAATLALLAADRPEAQRAERALSLLEAGRAVLLGRVLDTRGDLTALRRAQPELAERFAALRELLDREPAPDERPDRVGVATALAATLREIRRSPGFAGFALPPTAEELRAEAGHGPIVTLTVANGGTALLLTEDGTTALPLPRLTVPGVIDQVNAFHVALHEAADPAADRVAAQQVLLDVLGWLWDAVAGPVLDALGYRDTPADDAPWPRLWWAPGGYLSLLPLHAAGHHSTGPGVLDRVVSSYTPTIRSLRHARDRRRAARGAPDRALVVAMPVTPGLPDLHHVGAETELLSELLPGADVLTAPERAQVLAELPTHAVAHFACHGTYDVANPAESRLLLRDHERAPLTAGDLNAVNLEGVHLAYLSACHTAMNSAEGLLDEAMHLAGALQAAGFPQVVGTLWELDDEVAVDVAGGFYRGLRTDGAIDPGAAAHSLHHAVRALREEYPATPSLWASHLHFGA